MFGRVKSKQDEALEAKRLGAPKLAPDPDIDPALPEEALDPSRVPANEGGTADVAHDHTRKKR